MKNSGLATAILFLAIRTALWSQVAQQGVRHLNSAFIMSEDASLPEPGTFSVGPYVSYTNVPGGYTVSAPGIYFSLGLNRRVEVSGFGAMARSRDEQKSLNGTDDTYLSAKMLVSPEGDRRLAVAIMPSFELLGSATVANNRLAPHRANLVLPLLIEENFEPCSFSYTGGYVSRGVAFSSLKWEWNRWDHFSPRTVVYASRVTRDLGTISQLGLNRTQFEAAVGADIQVNPKWSISLESGRTFGRRDENSARLGLSAGITFTGHPWRSSAKNTGEIH
jgi:hypothetical protein